MQAAGPIFNLTPHEIVLYDKDDDTVLHRFESKGALRLASTRQTALPPALLRDESVVVSVITGQRFFNIHEESPGVDLWRACCARRMGCGVIVSLPTAQWLAQAAAANAVDVGRVTIYATATGPGMAVRDAAGQLLGCRALEAYVVDGKPLV